MSKRSANRNDGPTDCSGSGSAVPPGPETFEDQFAAFKAMRTSIESSLNGRYSALVAARVEQTAALHRTEEALRELRLEMKEVGLAIPDEDQVAEATGKPSHGQDALGEAKRKVVSFLRECKGSSCSARYIAKRTGVRLPIGVLLRDAITQGIVLKQGARRSTKYTFAR